VSPQAPGAHLPDHPGFLWRNPEPKRAYDVVIIGGGGHGLATAHYLVKNHGITNVAVLDKGWLAGGNMARNTTHRHQGNRPHHACRGRRLRRDERRCR
jgi:sarcosine oxidase subunit beta